MTSEFSIFSLFLVFTGAAVLAAATLYARQSLLVAYIALGVLLGPWGLRLIHDTRTVQEIGHVGIIFLLYLLGLNLHPQKLIQLLNKATVVTVASGLAAAALGYAVAAAFGFTAKESFVVGVAMMFSSTIIGLKLLPTTVLHHRHTGEIIISILLLQDIIAIVALLFLGAGGRTGPPLVELGLLAVALPGLVLLAFAGERWLLVPLMRRFDTIQEYVFLTAIGWGLGLAQLAKVLGLSYEIGAFVAGVALAANPIARYIAESLKPLRDFFLIMFFFSLGAGVNLPRMGEVLPPALLLAALMLLTKPVIFRLLLGRTGEPPALSWEVGVRLGQVSEFSLLIAVLAVQVGAIGEAAAYLIQAATLLTFIVSSYAIMLRYPTPIAVDERLRRG